MGTVIFDLDGTLADTSADLISGANACFCEMGYGAPLDPARDASTAVKGARAMLRLGLARLDRPNDETTLDRLYPVVLKHYSNCLNDETQMYPGAVDAIHALREAGYRTGICTNKPEGLAVALIDSLGVAGLFDSLTGGDTLPVRKPDPAPYFRAVADAGGHGVASLLVGDTTTDRETARAAGVPSVLVTFGPDGHDVSVLEPEALLHSYVDLHSVIARLLD